MHGEWVFRSSVRQSRRRTKEINSDAKGASHVIFGTVAHTKFYPLPSYRLVEHNSATVVVVVVVVVVIVKDVLACDDVCDVVEELLVHLLFICWVLRCSSPSIMNIYWAIFRGEIQIGLRWTNHYKGHEI